MIHKLIIEASECDFKVSLERKRPKSWLKSVSGFANTIGGTLFFGVDDDAKIVGIENPQKDAEFISQYIKDKIMPLPDFFITPHEESGKTYLEVKIHSGRQTPYYYKSDGKKEAFIRIGNETIVAPDYVVNELILKGTNRSFDALITDIPKTDYSFTLLEATYRNRTGIRFDSSDYISFGLTNIDGFLTNAGKLFTDQKSVYNSRVFCTRWKGLAKGSIFDDALDDKEYEGNLIYLLENSVNFIKTNSKVRFEKMATYRLDKPDYSERAVTEALVNALIHRDYLIMGSEVHIDMYDNRLEITSPGGMYSGKPIQERNIDEITSIRRNPIIADLFHRMKFMERRGSGLKKILDETQKLPGYSKKLEPQFKSTSSGFIVTIQNINDQINDQINEIDKNVLNLMRGNKNITSLEMSEKLNISLKTVVRSIKKLRELNILERIGSNKTGYWQVNKENICF